MTLIPRHEILAVTPATHGAFDFAELEGMKLNPDEVLDFSVNSNPYGPSPLVREAIAQVPLDRYPDREALALRRVLSARLNVPPDCLLAGNGAAELLWLIALAYLRSGDPVLVIGPTFGEYERAARLMGARVEWWQARAEENFTVDASAIEGRLEQVRPRLLFLCNPNNPTGALLPLDTIDRWCARFPSTLVVVDEAYLEFASEASSALSLGRPNLLVVRSMTKEYALAGLRLGYAAGSESVIQALSRARPPWSVNALAQVAGLASLADQSHLTESLARLRRAHRELVAGLEVVGFSPIPSATHFFLLEVGEGRAFRLALLRHGILVRDAASFGLPSYVRIASRRKRENERLLTAIRQLAWPAGAGKEVTS